MPPSPPSSNATVTEQAASLAELQAAVVREPRNSAALNNLAAELQSLRRFAEAEQLLRRAILVSPDAPMLFRNLGNVLASAGGRGEALLFFDRAAELDPDDPYTAIGGLMAELPAIASSREEGDLARRGFDARLARLEARLDDASAAEWARYAEAIGTATPFYLSYLGGVDRELYSRYGAFAARAMGAAYREYAHRPKSRERRPGPLRVGFVSGFFFYHSVFKIPLRGWLRTLDRQKFQLFAYHTRANRDACTVEAESCVHKFVQGPKSTREWCEAIAEDALDVVIFPDTVMDPSSCRLALLRHASVQCATWGHPVTTGFPTLDYFLSGDAMEPEGAAEQYTETLIRLPRLGVHLDLQPGPVATNLAALSLPHGVELIFACQSLYKYLPEHDDLFPRIALGAKGARFVFIEGAPAVTARFRERLASAFASHGLVSDDYLVFVPPVSPAQFSVYASAMSLALDSVGWSGCNSSLEILSHDVPIVTMRGTTMRASHTAAMFDVMGLRSHVSGTTHAYVERAILLIHDRGARESARGEIAERKGRLARDAGAVRALERFFETAHARAASLNDATAS